MSKELSLPYGAVANPSGSRFGVALSLGLLYVIWGSTYLGIRLAVESIPPFLMGGMRFVIAGTILFVALKLTGAALPTRTQVVNAGIVGLFLLVGGNGLLAYAEQTVSSGLAAILIATVTLWTALFAGFMGTRPNGLEWSGIAVGLAGVVILNLNSQELQASPIGAGAVLMSAMLWAIGTVIAQRVTMPTSGMASAVEMLVAGAVMLVLSPLLGERLVAMPSTHSLVAFVYLIAAGIVGFTAYNYVLRHTRPALATSYAYVNPVVALMLGALLLDERIQPSGIGATVLILAGVVLVIYGKRRAGS